MEHAFTNHCANPEFLIQAIVLFPSILSDIRNISLLAHSQILDNILI